MKRNPDDRSLRPRRKRAQKTLVCNYGFSTGLHGVRLVVRSLSRPHNHPVLKCPSQSPRQVSTPDFQKSFLKRPEDYAYTNVRSLRTAGGRTLKEAQPYASIEEGVTVAPSAIRGLGMFATKAFKQGDTVACYSGEMVKFIDGNTSAYLIEAKWYNKDTKTHEKWYLDSSNLDNACGRAANDACSSHGDGGYSPQDFNKIPSAYRTNYRNNVGYRQTIKPELHPVYKSYYLEMFALYDLEKNEECFGKYGVRAIYSPRARPRAIIHPVLARPHNHPVLFNAFTPCSPP